MPVGDRIVNSLVDGSYPIFFVVYSIIPNIRSFLNEKARKYRIFSTFPCFLCSHFSQSLTYKTTPTASSIYVTQNLKLNKQNRTAYLNGQITINTTISGNQTALFTVDKECEPYVFKHNQIWVPILGVATDGKLYPFFLRQNYAVYFISSVTYPAGITITFNEKWLTD